MMNTCKNESKWKLILKTQPLNAIFTLALTCKGCSSRISNIKPTSATSIGALCGYEQLERAYFPKAKPVGLINQILDSQRTILCLHMQAHLFPSSSFSLWVWKDTYVGKMQRETVIGQRTSYMLSASRRYMLEMFGYNCISNCIYLRMEKE
jgi:hypothetical protein